MFPRGPDCVLSMFKVASLSLHTNTRSVSDGLPYPTKTDLGNNHASYPILYIITVGFDY